jgi:hypothetical protein
MNVIFYNDKRACLVVALAILVGQAAHVTAQTVLIDFGSDTSYRGLSVNNPDTNGNYWNSVQPGLLVTDLIDIDNAATTIDLGWDTPVGTDSYNGPAGPTDETTLETDVQFTDIDAAALGNLGGSFEGVFDFAAGFNGIEHFAVRFQIQGLSASSTYNLTFFGSHAFSNDGTTVYTVFTDDTYTTPVASTMLDVQDPVNFFEHNRDQVATITGVAPQADNILYIQFVGETGFGGYLNAMQIEAVAAPGQDGDYNEDGRVDGADYVVWRKDPASYGGDPAGYNLWRANFGEGIAGAGGAIPEPSAMLLIVCAVAFAMCQRQR